MDIDSETYKTNKKRKMGAGKSLVSFSERV